MKKRNWISLLLIVVCLATLFGYQTVDRVRTDVKAPVITMEEQLLELSVQDPREALLAGVTAQDDRDGDVTASLVVESIRLLQKDGTVTVTYAAFDRSGNVAKQSREVRYTDYHSPRFALTQPLMFSQNAKQDVLNVVTAWDVQEGDISHRVRATTLDPVSSGYSSIYHVKYQVTNTLGDSVELVLPVETFTSGMYAAHLSLTDYLVYLKAGDYFNARSYLSQLDVGRESISLDSGVPEELKLTISGRVETGEPGIYQVDYQISYCPNPDRPEQTYTAYSRLIVIVEG